MSKCEQRSGPDREHHHRDKRKENWPDSRISKKGDRSDRPLPPPYALNIDADELVCYHLKDKDFVRWPEQKDAGRDPSKYCEFQKGSSHSTETCRALRGEIIEMLKKGHLREFLNERGRKTYGLDEEAKLVETYHEEVQEQERTPSPSPIHRLIGMISGGSIFSGETSSTCREHTRRAKTFVPR